ncbi:hypothetical protein ACFLTE_11230 [Bacteroidota bacterium]
MKIIETDISTFNQNSDFYPEIDLLITIKSFDLQAIRKRYLESKKSKSNRTGSVTRREVAEGGIAKMSIKEGQLFNVEILKKLKEPRGIDFYKGKFAISSENKVFIIDEELYEISNPWFSYIHTVNFHPVDQNKILISSSGYDAIFEYDYRKNTQTFEWFAWENGFENGFDPNTGEKVFLTRIPELAEIYDKEGINHIYIFDPESQTLPTAKRSAFINSVLYDTQNSKNIIGTFFHEGAVYSININNNKTTKILSGLKNPHGGRRFSNGHLATSTGDGRVVIQNKIKQILHFNKLLGKPDELGEMEWLQNSAFMGSNLITIDSNRNCFVICNLKKQMIDLIPYDINWAIQDIVIGNLDIKQIELIKNVS